MKKYHVTIDSKTDRLSYVREFISNAARTFGFDEESVSKIALAVDEACTNIIKHSYEFASNRQIDINIVTNKTSFEIIITHDGKLFDPNRVQEPDMKDYINHPRRGGLGIHLMRLLMDGVEYRILPNKKSEVRLVKYLP